MHFALNYIYSVFRIVSVGESTNSKQDEIFLLGTGSICLRSTLERRCGMHLVLTMVRFFLNWNHTFN
jgi:hypothetical protein